MEKIINMLGIEEQFLNHVSDRGCSITDDHHFFEMIVSPTEGANQQVFFNSDAEPTQLMYFFSM